MSTTYNHIMSDETGLLLHADLQAIVALGTTKYNEAIATAEEAVDTADATALLEEYDRQLIDNIYAGREIATIPEIADEVATYGTVWQFLHARATTGDWTGLRIGDWFEVTPTGASAMRYQIAAFDHYYNCADQAMGHHVFCVPTAPWGENVLWNTTNTNQGTSAQKNPYLVSNLHTWEISTFLPKLPSTLQNVLINHRSLVEDRYSSSGGLNASTGWHWDSLGKVFSLSEMEVYGCCVCGTPQWSQGMDSQLPLFRETKNRIKSRAYWWLRVANGSSSTNVCRVGNYGDATATAATYASLRPLPCFLIG